MGRGLEKLDGSLGKGRFGGCWREWCIGGRCRGILRLEMGYVNLLAEDLMNRPWER